MTRGGPIVECVPNFSEGRDARVIDSIERAIRTAPVAVLDRTSDPDHNRSVITFAGPPEAVSEAGFRAVAEAARRIDLARHSGVHPRIGAADVVPFVPVREIDLEACVQIARITGERIWRELGVPVYLYEAAALRPECANLPEIRRDPTRRPDFGDVARHPTAGATVVGARKFLIAFNVNLTTADVAIAKRIAAKIREASGGLPCVKALGVPLASRKLAQVTMNLTDFERTPVHVVFAAVREEAAREGAGIAGSEIAGLIPEGALEGAEEWLPTVENFRDELILENRLRQAGLLE
ncbi:MAG: glutamate formimidoyltransferase [Bryobacteraceae bacterium]